MSLHELGSVISGTLLSPNQVSSVTKTGQHFLRVLTALAVKAFLCDDDYCISLTVGDMYSLET